MYAGFPEEGDRCLQHGCDGRLRYPRVTDCSCHISAPCSACTSSKLECDVCGWIDDSPDETYVQLAPGLAMLEMRPRPLDPTKIDFRRQMHSNSSMKIVGVYPEGTTAAEVQAVVNGTFGGRFEKFANGHFVFIAYTD